MVACTVRRKASTRNNVRIWATWLYITSAQGLEPEESSAMSQAEPKYRVRVLMEWQALLAEALILVSELAPTCNFRTSNIVSPLH